MMSSLVVSTGDEAALLADIARLTPEPRQVGEMLVELGYQTVMDACGKLARNASGQPDLTLFVPLYAASGLTVRRRDVFGARISRCAALVAVLGALRAVPADRRPGALFLLEQPVASVPPGRSYSIEGGVVPKIWPGCFGSFNLLLRIVGRSAEPGSPGLAINAIEEGIPVLQALARLKATIAGRDTSRPRAPDSPLKPRLSICAAHGGSADAGLPRVFDVLINRRYDPAEDQRAAQADIKRVVQEAIRPELAISVSASVTNHLEPRPDPDLGSRRPESEALAVGWRWPQVAFRIEPSMAPDALLFGGLDRTDIDPNSERAHTSFDDIIAFRRALCHLFLAEEPAWVSPLRPSA